MNSTTNQIEEIKNRLDVVQVVGKYVKLRQAGKNHSGLCPFHNEKTPSFIVSPDLQRYKCFGCGETGDIFNFVQKVENIDFAEALEKLAKEAGVELKKQPGNYKYKVLEDINYIATKYYYRELKKNQKALEYLLDRGFNEDSIKAFGVGYSPKSPKLQEYLLKTKRYSRNELLDSGLFTLKENHLREKFYDRIMFPIRSKMGTVLAFTARVLPGNSWGPKYMNSPDTPIFHKKDNVFGQYESRQSIRKDDLAIFCEGSTDVISAHQHGIKNIVAPLGTGLTKEQLENISTLTKNLLFFFDSDEAGSNALIRAFKLASELKLNPYATNASPHKDIDELLQKEPKKMLSLIKNRQEAFTFILSNYIKDMDLNKLEHLNKARSFLNSLLLSVADSTTRTHYIQKASNITKMDISDFKISSEKYQRTEKPATSVPVKKADNTVEKKYIQLLLLLEKLTPDLLVTEELVTTEPLNKIYKVIKLGKYENRDQLYKKLTDDKDLNTTFENLVFHLTDIPASENDITNELLTIKERLKTASLKKKQKNLSVKIAMAEEDNNNEDSEKYMKELIEINKLLKGS